MEINIPQSFDPKNEFIVSNEIIYAVDMHRKAMTLVFTCKYKYDTYNFIFFFLKVNQDFDFQFRGFGLLFNSKLRDLFESKSFSSKFLSLNILIALSRHLL